MGVVRAAAVQLSPALHDREAMVRKVAQKIHELGHDQAVTSHDEEAAARDLIARLAGKVRSMPRRAPG